MGRYLNRARLHFGTDTRGMLEGGRYALVYTRSLELDDLRPYVPGDDVRDIDWKASARAGAVLIKRFVSERHHKILLVADAGRNMSALTPTGEVKREVAVDVMGAVGLISMGRSDEIGMVYGDSRGSVNTRNRRGETHIESILEDFYIHSLGDVGTSDITTQLEYVARAHRRRLLLVVVSDEPEVTPRLDEVLTQLIGQHEMVWLMITDMPAVGADEGEHDGYDVATGRFVLNGTVLGPRVVAAYRAAEQQRAAQLDAFLTSHEVCFTRIAGSAEIRDRLVEVSEVYSSAVR
ncbi:DUF58 domain-containing protein [Mycolicibacterium thermoresistibile]|jgi:uncharacterized protein (DUF58 family)|uniref:DUF58 domain-containing protein n=2 Tax=Mycolicibacterium thermoresistibile TaxID=1797 RepID=G7CML7_MYCT3|nr:DUF58 domain-containing protein [Mycolicibacterium thermoresistibile]EHI10720.1 hypothetical protein KEK_21320 [Mycolicibacterium thermoresistibile ATCC 19527]MCV7189280.1 DUF58 domain-containing protein [Mycolicibacterium thermoresistibile]GAT16595.1 putative uncharacterized protein [Mycolicibacterium thermoresistibile]SNW17718.1 ATPase family protein associated with various cellular activities [Mycolicibacterium thermoresistibile]